MHDSLIRDRIVCGVKEERLRSRLLREADLTLQKAIDICRANETTQSQMKVLKEEVDMQSVQRLNKSRGNAKRFVKEHKSPREHETDASCAKCGYRHAPMKCPAFGQTCNACKKRNHYAKMCKQARSENRTKKMHTVEHEHEQDDEFPFLGTLEVKHNTSHVETIVNAQMKTEKEKWTETLCINGRNVTFKLDTGAECNVISHRVFKSLKLKSETLSVSHCKLVTYSGHRMAPKGQSVEM